MKRKTKIRKPLYSSRFYYILKKMGGGNKKVKKELVMLVAAMVIMGLICVIATTVANDLIIGREMEIEGTGVVTAELRIDTQAYYPGVMLGEDLSTPGGGYNGLSSTRYASSFEVGIYNTSGNASSELGYMSSARTVNVKRSVYSSNYGLGSVMGFKSIGNSEQDVEIYTDDSGMGADISGKIIGKMKIFNKVVDIDDHHAVIVRDVVDIAGNYTYEWSAYDEMVFNPEIELGNDWLGCP